MREKEKERERGGNRKKEKIGTEKKGIRDK